MPKLEVLRIFGGVTMACSSSVASLIMVSGSEESISMDVGTEHSFVYSSLRSFYKYLMMGSLPLFIADGSAWSGSPGVVSTA